MSHKIDQTKKATGAFYSYKKKAWHGLGTVLDRQPNDLPELLELSGLNYQVEKFPNVVKLPDVLNNSLSTHATVAGMGYTTLRTDTLKPLGMVGERYTVMQNSEALSVIEPFFNNKEVTIETAGAIDGGRQMFIVCKKNTPIVLDGTDEVENYFTIFNSHDGSLAIMAYFTPIRVVCNNTLQMSFKNCKQKISVRHTLNAESKLKQAAKILLTAEKNADNFKEAAQQMRKTKFTQSKFFDYLANVFCTKDEIKLMGTGAHPFEALSTRKANTIKGVIEYAEGGVGQKEAVTGSAWWAYNAVTGYYSNKEYTSDEKKFNSLYFSGANNVMSKALTLASPDAKINPVLNLN